MGDQLGPTEILLFSFAACYSLSWKQLKPRDGGLSPGKQGACKGPEGILSTTRISKTFRIKMITEVRNSTEAGRVGWKWGTDFTAEGFSGYSLKQYLIDSTQNRQGAFVKKKNQGLFIPSRSCR